MRILAIETATDVCSVAVTENNQLLSESTLTVPRKHAETLSPLIQQQFRFLPFSFDELDAIAVSIGPGSFTGLRIGLSTAKGLLFAQETQLLAIPTLAASAWSARNSAEQVQVLHHSHRDFFFFAVYNLQNGITALNPPVRAKFSDLENSIDRAIPLLVNRADKLPQEQTTTLNILKNDGARARYVASLGEAFQKKYAVEKPYMAEPDYLKKYEAVKFQNPLNKA